jgi:hypothetical protein
MVPRDTIKPAEVLVIQVAPLPSVIAGREFGVENRILNCIKRLHLIGTVLMTPITITVLTIPMVIYTLIYYCRHLTHTGRAFHIKLRLCHLRNITHHKFLHYGARTTFLLIQRIAVPRFRTGLMEKVTAVAVLLT